jgi:hypothetical protein
MDARVGFDLDERHGMSLHAEPHDFDIGDFDSATLLGCQPAEARDDGAGMG